MTDPSQTPVDIDLTAGPVAGEPAAEVAVDLSDDTTAATADVTTGAAAGPVAGPAAGPVVGATAAGGTDEVPAPPVAGVPGGEPAADEDAILAALPRGDWTAVDDPEPRLRDLRPFSGGSHQGSRRAVLTAIVLLLIVPLLFLLGWALTVTHS